MTELAGGGAGWTCCWPRPRTTRTSGPCLTAWSGKSEPPPQPALPNPRRSQFPTRPPVFRFQFPPCRLGSSTPLCFKSKIQKKLLADNLALVALLVMSSPLSR